MKVITRNEGLDFYKILYKFLEAWFCTNILLASSCLYSTVHRKSTGQRSHGCQLGNEIDLYTSVDI